MIYTISTLAENRPGVIYRVADQLLRRGVNILSMTASESQTPGMSRFIMTVDADKKTVEQIVKQAYKVIEVVKVDAYIDSEVHILEVAFFRVSCKNAKARNEIKDIIALSGSHVVSIDKDEIIISLAQDESAITKLKNQLTPYGIKEVVRSGRIAIKK